MWKQFGESIIDDALSLSEQGLTNREIGNTLSIDQVRCEAYN